MFEIREYIDDRDRVTNREVVNILEEVGDLERTVVNAEGGGEGDEATMRCDRCNSDGTTTGYNPEIANS